VIELTIREKGAAREFSSRGGSTGKVCDAKAVDDDGSEVSVSLWNEEIERVQPNDRIRITTGGPENGVATSRLARASTASSKS